MHSTITSHRYSQQLNWKKKERKKEFYATSSKIIQNREKKKQLRCRKKRKENSIPVRNRISKLWLTPPVKKQSNKISLLSLSSFLILFTLETKWNVKTRHAPRTTRSAFPVEMRVDGKPMLAKRFARLTNVRP